MRGIADGIRLGWEGVGARVVADAELPADFRKLPAITLELRFSVVPSNADLSIEFRLRVIMLVRNISSTVSLRVRFRSGVD